MTSSRAVHSSSFLSRGETDLGKRFRKDGERESRTNSHNRLARLQISVAPRLASSKEALK